MNPHVPAILRATAESICQPGAWSQGASHRDSEGVDLDAGGTVATSWCVGTMISNFTAEITGDRYSPAYAQACSLVVTLEHADMGSDEATDLIVRLNDSDDVSEESLAVRLCQAAAIAERTQ